MYKIAAFTIVAFFAIVALGQESDADKQYVECAHEKIETLFGNRTYINGCLACLKDQESPEANEVRDMVNKIGTNIDQYVKYFENEPESVEKYDKLYEDLAGILEDNDKIREKMKALDKEVQKCIEFELQKACGNVKKSEVCKEQRE